MVRKNQIILSSEAFDVIRRNCGVAYPYECCGALIGRDRLVIEALPLPNTTEEGAQTRFRVRPTDYQMAEQRALRLNAELMGFYHSHPDHPASPSQYDLDHAWPVFAYVIVSVDRGQPREVTSWRLTEDRSAFCEESVKVITERDSGKKAKYYANQNFDSDAIAHLCR